MDNSINLSDILGFLRKHFFKIIVSMIVGGSIGAIVTFFVLPPKYSSQAQLIVTLPASEQTNLNSVDTNLQLINTYKDMIVSDMILNDVLKRLNTKEHDKLTIEQLREAISVDQTQNSQIFYIQAISTNAKTSQRIANETSLIFQKKTKEIMNIDKISIVSKATANPIPVTPNKKLNLIISVVIGVLCGCGLSMLVELFDRTLKNEEYITEKIGLTIIGNIPKLNSK